MSFNIFLRRLWYAVAILIFLAAILFNLSRLFLPSFLQRHSAYWEQLATKSMHLPVKIERVSAGWQIFSPTLEFHGVDLLSQEDQHVLFHVKRLEAKIDI